MKLMRRRSHKISFKHALDGLVHAVSTQPNFVIHLIISVLVVGVGLWVGLTAGEWLVIVLTISAGLVIELVNTAIETTVDLVTRKYHPLAKIAKDTASAAMLVFAVGAAIVGSLIILPKLLVKF